MTTSVKMPALGESITEGTITRWLKQEGDRVEADEPLFEVSTDKVDTEVPSPASGTLQQITVGEDQTAEVGTELALIAGDDEGEGAGGAAEEQEQPAADAREEPAEEEPAEEVQADTSADEQEAPAAEETQAQEAEAAEPTPSEDTAPPEGTPETTAATTAGEGGTEDGGAGGTTVVTMPALGESITEGTITRWLKQEGDRVEADEPLFEVSTDKVDTEVPSPVAGTLQEIRIGEDQTAEVGAELAVVASGDGAARQPQAEQREQAPAEDETAGAEPQAAETAPARGQAPAQEQAPARGQQARDRAGDGGVVSPLVRKLVREHSVDLAEIEGTGAGGRVRRQDVLAYVSEQEGDGRARPAARQAPAAEAKETAPAPAREPAAAPGPKAVPVQAVPLPTGVREEVVKASRIRRIIAERMVSSLQTSAQLTVGVEIDMTRVMRLRAQAKDAFKQREGVSLSPLPFAVMAVIGAVREHPMANAAFDGDFNLHLYKDVNLGVAVDTPKGLYVPVIRNADRLNLTGIAQSIADIAERTRAGKIDPAELSGSTISVTNTGSVGAVWDTPIINQPNACIFATPAITRRPVVVDDPELGEVVAVRHIMNGVLTYDHRILDGADAARFLGTIKRILEAGDFASELGLEAGAEKGR